MERFIAVEEGAPGVSQENLKSSMERFIGKCYNVLYSAILYLKSSMERFIGIYHTVSKKFQRHLKSSMERFIVCDVFVCLFVIFI